MVWDVLVLRAATQSLYDVGILDVEQRIGKILSVTIGSVQSTNV